MTAVEVGVNCGELGVGEAGGIVVDVGEGGNAGVIVLVGKMPVATGVRPVCMELGKLHAMISKTHPSKKTIRCFLMVSPLALLILSR